MKRMYGIAVSMALALTLPAVVQANVTGVLTGTSSKIEFTPGHRPNPSGVYNYDGTQIAVSRRDPNAFGGATAAATSRVDSGGIAFQNGGAAAGPYTRVTTSTSVDISFVNDGSTPVIPRLVSTIQPAGFGLYVGDIGGACSVASITQCPSTTRGLTFADFASDANGLIPNALAGASFGVQILSDGVEIYSLKGSVALLHDVATDTNFLTEDISAGSSLSGFSRVSPAGSDDWIGYAWDATPLSLAFPTVLGVGDSRTLSYITTTSAYSSSDCGNSCLIGYSAFGDPVGRSGTINAISIAPIEFALPTFRFARLVFQVPPSTVPEPSSWLLMIAGFGLIGSALRTRRADAVA